jgi:hypothetical protein
MIVLYLLFSSCWGNSQEEHSETWITVQEEIVNESVRLILSVATNRVIFGKELVVRCEVCNTSARPKTIYMPGLSIREDYLPAGDLSSGKTGVIPIMHRRFTGETNDYVSLGPDDCYSRRFTFAPKVPGELQWTLWYRKRTDQNPSAVPSSGVCRLRVRVEGASAAIEYLSGVLQTNQLPERRADAAAKLGIIKDGAAIAPLAHAVAADPDGWVRCLAIVALQKIMEHPADPLPSLGGASGDPFEMIRVQKARIDSWLSTRTNSILKAAQKRLALK